MVLNVPTDINDSFAATAPTIEPPRRMVKREQPKRDAAVSQCEKCGKVRVRQYVQVTCDGRQCFPAWVRKTPEAPWWDVAAWVVWLSKVLHYLGWLASGPVDEPTESRRNHACVELCQFAVKRDGHVWCPFCGCPQIPGADVRVKNKRTGHNCPIGMHAGSVPEPGPFVRARKAYGLSLVAPKRRKCGGCGG